MKPAIVLLVLASLAPLAAAQASDDSSWGNNATAPTQGHGNEGQRAVDADESVEGGPGWIYGGLIFVAFVAFGSIMFYVLRKKDRGE